jgi:hypothetical protein
VLITIVTFAVYTMINDERLEFNASNVFTALALFNQLTVPLFIFPITIPIIISSLISTRRIERFLSQQPEIEKEFEGVKHMARVLSKSIDDDEDEGSTTTTTGQGHKKAPIGDKLPRQDTIDEEEMDEIKINDGHQPSSDDLIALNNCDGNENLTHNESVILRNKSNLRATLKKQNQLNESTRIERNKLRSTTFVADKHGSGNLKRTRLPSFKVPDGVAVWIKDAKFSWEAVAATSKLLEIDNLSIPLGEYYRRHPLSLCEN